MATVVLEVVLSDAGFHDMPRQDRRLGYGHREAHRRHAAGPIVPLQDHRAPSPQPLQVLLMSDIPHFSTHTTARPRDRRTARARTCVNPERASGVPFVSVGLRRVFTPNVLIVALYSYYLQYPKSREISTTSRFLLINNTCVLHTFDDTTLDVCFHLCFRKHMQTCVTRCVTRCVILLCDSGGPMAASACPPGS